MSTPWERRAAARAQAGGGYIPPIPLSPEQRSENDRKNAAEAARLKIEQERLRLAQEEDARKRAEEQANLTKAAEARSDAQTSMYDVLNQIERVQSDATDSGSFNGWDLNGWGETGLTGAALGIVPGSAGYDLRGKLGMIDSNAAFDRLQRMRETSPTGGALGAVSAPELALLKSSISNLDPNQSQSEFLDALNTARSVYTRNLERIGGAPPGASLGAMVGARGAPRQQAEPPAPPARPATPWFGRVPANAPRRQNAQSGWGRARVID